MTVKVDIISGFLGAGKTSLINKLLEARSASERIAVIENEYGKIGIDSDLLKKDGIQVKDITAGCICCSLAEDLDKALEEIYHNYRPDRIIIEPTGIGKLSDIIKACNETSVSQYLQINSLITIVNVMKFEMLNAGFGDFFQNQIQNADIILFSRLQKAEAELIEKVAAGVRKLNPHARIITTPWEDMNIEELLLDRYSTPEHAHDCTCSCCAKNPRKAHSHTSLDSWGVETRKIFDERNLVGELKHLNKYGEIVRGKGILQCSAKQWLQFDYVQGELNIRNTNEANTGKVSFIGRHLDAKGLSEFFI